MKKILAAALSCVMLISLFGCKKQEQDISVPTTQAPTLPASRPIPMHAISLQLTNEQTPAEDGAVLFQDIYQNISMVVPDPEIADKVILDFLNYVDSKRYIAESLLEEAKAQYVSSELWTPYLCQVILDPMRIDKAVLSLFGDFSTYSGQAHPAHSCISASYDLTTGDPLTLASIMSADATKEAFCELTLEELAKVEQSSHLYPDYASAVERRFTADETADNAWYFSQRGLCFYFPQYELAPYSSGVIVAEIPYEKLTGLIYDGYFPVERDMLHGNLVVEPFDVETAESFLQIAEVTLDHGADKYLIYSEGGVYDVRLTCRNESTGTVLSGYSVFASYALSEGDAILLEASPETCKMLLATYTSDGQTVEFIPFDS